MRIPSGKTDQVIYFVAVDAIDLKTRETGLSSFTVYRSRNGGAATAYTTPTVTELSAANMPGVYSLAIDEDTTIAAGSDSEEYVVHITQASMAPVTRSIELYRRDTTTGRTATVDASGRVDVGAVGGTSQTAGDIIGDTNDIQSRLPAALVNGKMSATDAVATGTSDSGTTTTVVDAARTEADTDYWKGCWIRFTSGNIAGQVRYITGFTPASDTITFIPATTQAVATQDYEILPAGAVNVYQWRDTTVPSPSAGGRPVVDVTHFGGSAGTFSGGRAEVNTSHVGGTIQTAGDIIADTNDIQARLPAALVGGKMSATESLAAGTSDSGTTTTMVDAARTEADTDYWKGCLIKFTSGNIAGQVRYITGFTPASDTITFIPATTQAVATQDYEILPAGAVNVYQWRDTTVPSPSAGGRPLVDVTHFGGSAGTFSGGRAEVNTSHVGGTIQTAGDIIGDTNDIQTRLPAALVGGRMDSNMQAAANGVITAAVIATDAIDSDAIAASAVTEIQSGLSTLDAAGVRAAVGLASANLDTQIDALPTANENADALLDRADAIETGWTIRKAWRIALAALAGKSSGHDTNAPVYRNVLDSKDRITATTSSDGRTSVTLDGT